MRQLLRSWLRHRVSGRRGAKIGVEKVGRIAARGEPGADLFRCEARALDALAQGVGEFWSLLDSLLQGLLRLNWGRDRRILRRSARDNHGAEGESTQRRAFSGRHHGNIPHGPEGIETKTGPQVVASQGVATVRKGIGRGGYGCAAVWPQARSGPGRRGATRAQRRASQRRTADHGSCSSRRLRPDRRTWWSSSWALWVARLQRRPRP